MERVDVEALEAVDHDWECRELGLDGRELDPDRAAGEGDPENNRLAAEDFAERVKVYESVKFAGAEHRPVGKMEVWKLSLIHI